MRLIIAESGHNCLTYENDLGFVKLSLDFHYIIRLPRILVLGYVVLGCWEVDHGGICVRLWRHSSSELIQDLRQ